MRITSDLAEFLKKHGKTKRYNQGEVVVREGEYSDSVFIILDGVAEIVKANAAGGESVIAEADRGAVFGEMGAFLNYKRSATVRAKSVLTVIMFNSQSFIQALFKLPDLTIRVIKSFANRVQELNEKLTEATYSKLMIVVGVAVVEQYRQQKKEAGGELEELKFDMTMLSTASRIETDNIKTALEQLKTKKAIETLVFDGDHIARIKLKTPALTDFINSISYVEERMS